MTTMHPPTDHRTSGPLKYLVYTSSAAPGLTQRDLDEILQTARRHNASAEITGILLFRDDCFVQFLEGAPAELDALMESIVADRRHHGVRVILTDQVSERSFPEWRMGFRAIEDAPRADGDEVQESFDDLTSERGEDIVRHAATDVSEWFRAGERAGATTGRGTSTARPVTY